MNSLRKDQIERLALLSELNIFGPVEPATSDEAAQKEYDEAYIKGREFLRNG